MTQEEKQLLFKDLCARLPYHVRCKIWLKDNTTEEGPLDLEHNYADVLQDAFYYKKIKDIKPYLRPMSSMTEGEQEEFLDLIICVDKGKGVVEEDKIDAYNNFIYSHHLDNKNFIEKGLALEAPEGMYKTE